MTNIVAWPVKAATSKEELMDVLQSASSGIKTQVIASAVLADPRLGKLRERLSSIADELNGLQQDVVFPPTI